jgi:meiotic recombination protein REC8, fungi type
VTSERIPNHISDWFTEKSKLGREEDDDFPTSKKTKGKSKPKSIPLAENLRADLHTLNENHEHLLSASFDVSLNESGTLPPSSSHFDGGFDFSLDDNFFGASDGLDVGGGIGDELARELGEGWGASPMKSRNE